MTFPRCCKLIHTTRRRRLSPESKKARLNSEVISISSAFPVLPAQDSLYYELLALTAICGEVPCACADRLTSSKSYRKKVVTSLTHDKLLRIFSKDHLRGYRLGIRGKRLLRERAPERFQFYLSGRTDTNSIKSSPARRLRLHRIAQTYVTMLNAGTMIYRDEKPPVFVPGGSSPCRIEAPVFYDSREMKELGLEMVKVHGSRMAGSLLTPSRTFAVFNGMDAVPVFDTQIEQRGKIMLQNIRYTRNGVSHTPDGILLSDQWAVMTTLLEDAKTYKKEHFLFGEGYEHFYFLTNDYHGETLLWLLCHPDIIGQLNAMLLRELQPPCRNAYIDNIDIAGVTLPILGGLPDIRFESCQITESRMYIKAVNPRLQAEVSPGDIVQAGIIISNSEVGLGSVSIQPLIYRLVCSNGMVVNEAAARRNHVGRVTDSEENFSVYSQATLDAEDKAFVMKIQDTVRAAVEEARFAQVVGKMQEAKAAQMDTHDVPAVVKLASKEFHITDSESTGVLQRLIESNDLTLYGLSNAVTRHSQDVESYDRASELESIGYSILTMPPRQWSRINRAAA